MFRILFLLLVISTPSWGLTMDDLVQRDGLYYKKFTDIPFTGEVDEGTKKGPFKNGRKNGTWIWYHENGQLEWKQDFKNGILHGKSITYHDNGQLASEGNRKNGYREGTATWYYYNGQLMSEGKYKRSVLEGTWVEYFDNGQLKSKGEYKDSRREGAWVFYNKDGGKRMSKNTLGNIIQDEGSGVYRNGVKVSD